jgi:hemolysin III
VIHQPADLTTRPLVAVAPAVPATADHPPRSLADSLTDALNKPRARGWIHVGAAVAAVVAGAPLIATAWSSGSARSGWAALIYAAAIVAMFSVSAVYHRVQWTSAVRMTWMKRADHSLIFIFIAGSYTPFMLLAMPPQLGVRLLALVWMGAGAGVVLKMLWPSSPRWVGLPLYLLLGYVGIWYAESLRIGGGSTVVVLLAAGGLLYNVGAIFYWLRWPDPWPETFGYHELFHALTVAAALCHYIAVWGVIA